MRAEPKEPAAKAGKARVRRKSVVALTREMVQNHALSGDLAGFPASPKKKRQLGLVDASSANVANYSPQGKREHRLEDQGGIVGGFLAPMHVREGMSDVVSGFVAPLGPQDAKKEKREKRKEKDMMAREKKGFRPKCHLDPLPPIGRAA